MLHEAYVDARLTDAAGPPVPTGARIARSGSAWDLIRRHQGALMSGLPHCSALRGSVALIGLNKRDCCVPGLHGREGTGPALGMTCRPRTAHGLRETVISWAGDWVVQAN